MDYEVHSEEGPNGQEFLSSSPDDRSIGSLVAMLSDLLRRRPEAESYSLEVYDLGEDWSGRLWVHHYRDGDGCVRPESNDKW